MAETTMKTKRPETPVTILPVNSPKVRVSACPISEGHKNTRIYNTVGRTRYCVCDDCGHTWKMIADAADDWNKYLTDLAESLETAPSTTIGEDPEPVILLPVSEAKEIVARLRAIAKGA